MPTTRRGRFSKILVAIDGSQLSMQAAEYSIEIAKKDGAELIALTVNRMPWSTYGLVTPKHELESPKERQDVLESKQWLDSVALIAKANDLELKRELISTQMSIEGAIVDYAVSNGVDLIIMGTRGRSGLNKMFLGSVAAGVVNSSTCPVMIVK
jgi:nucleotide-binding universal stress UspA family protein